MASKIKKQKQIVYYSRTKNFGPWILNCNFFLNTDSVLKEQNFLPFSDENSKLHEEAKKVKDEKKLWIKSFISNKI